MFCCFFLQSVLIKLLNFKNQQIFWHFNPRILTFMSRINSTLSCVENENRLITSGLLLNTVKSTIQMIVIAAIYILGYLPYLILVIWRIFQPDPEVIKLFPCSTQLSKKFILLINVKMPTIVGILTFISMINTTSERLKARNLFICRCFSFYEQLIFRAQLS